MRHLHARNDHGRHHLLDKYPHPTMEQIREGLAGNLCRCTGYMRIFEAVQQAATQAERGRLMRRNVDDDALIAPPTTPPSARAPRVDAGP